MYSRTNSSVGELLKMDVIKKNKKRYLIRQTRLSKVKMFSICRPTDICNSQTGLALTRFPTLEIKETCHSISDPCAQTSGNDNEAPSPCNMEKIQIHRGQAVP